MHVRQTITSSQRFVNDGHLFLAGGAKVLSGEQSPLLPKKLTAFQQRWLKALNFAARKQVKGREGEKGQCGK